MDLHAMWFPGAADIAISITYVGPMSCDCRLGRGYLCSQGFGLRLWPAADAGFVVCDLIVKVRTGPMISTKWKNAHHARKRHCFWIVCRNGPHSERKRSVPARA